jgi:hypothetical protein
MKRNAISALIERLIFHWWPPIGFTLSAGTILYICFAPMLLRPEPPPTTPIQYRQLPAAVIGETVLPSCREG